MPRAKSPTLKSGSTKTSPAGTRSADLPSLGQSPVYTGKADVRVLIGTATLGTVRMEWHNALSGLVVPMNWANSVQTPVGFKTADAQNLIVHECLSKGIEWVLLLEDDVVPPLNLLTKLNEYMLAGEIPIVSGLYHLKSDPPEPMIFRGRGTGSYRQFKPGEAVWCDGVPTGCLIIHASILRAYAQEAETYTLAVNGQQVNLKRVFETPRKVFEDAHTGSYHKVLGTSDLYFCDQVIARGILKKAGWPKIASRKWPFLVDTSIRCGHICRMTGRIY